MPRFLPTLFLARGFRPFFLMAGIYAAVSVLVWAGFYADIITPPAMFSDPVIWHAHEMIFGFAMAVIGGFLLTAVANWTGWLPVRGAHLGALALLWIVGRVVSNIDFGLPAWSVAVLSAAFIPALAVSLAIPLLKTWNKRNFVFLVLLTALTACDVGTIMLDTRIPLYIALMLVTIMISLVGGRIIPSFTVAALRRDGVPAFQTDQPRMDAAALASLIAVIAALLYAATWPLAIVATISAALHALRMRRYHSIKALYDPMLWILHAGYAWIIIGLLLLALFGLGVVPLPIALHALTVGCIGSMTLGMMARVTMGHTGRGIQASRATTIAFALMQASAIIRVFAPLIAPDLSVTWIILSAMTWSVCFGMYTAVYGLMLLSPRIDGQEP